MTYQFYKLLHIAAVVYLFAGLGALAWASRLAEPAVAARVRKAALAVHGTTLIVVLVAGFGLLARLGLFSAIPVWAWLKIAIWLLLGLAILPLRRMPRSAFSLWLLLPLLGVAAAWLAIYKPF